MSIIRLLSTIAAAIAAVFLATACSGSNEAPDEPIVTPDETVEGSTSVDDVIEPPNECVEVEHGECVEPEEVVDPESVWTDVCAVCQDLGLECPSLEDVEVAIATKAAEPTWIRSGELCVEPPTLDYSWLNGVWPAYFDVEPDVIFELDCNFSEGILACEDLRFEDSYLIECPPDDPRMTLYEPTGFVRTVPGGKLIVGTVD